MSKNNFIQKWIGTMNQKQDEYKQKKEQHLQKFLKFIQKTPQKIINESKTLNKKDFKRTYSNHLNSFIAHLKNRNIEPKLIRETTDAVQDFFRYTKLPLSLGIRGHFNLFLK